MITTPSSGASAPPAGRRADRSDRSGRSGRRSGGRGQTAQLDQVRPGEAADAPAPPGSSGSSGSSGAPDSPGRSGDSSAERRERPGRSERWEWWERQQFRRQRREAAQAQHAQNPATASAGRAAASWIALAAVVTVSMVSDEMRGGLGEFARVAVLFVIWFALTRTRTLSWRAAAATFAGGVVWAVAVAGLSGPASSLISSDALLLAPLAIVVIAIPGRVRRFAVADWVLVGATLGLAYQGAEVAGRAIAASLGAAPAAHVGTGSGTRYLVFALAGAGVGAGIAIARHGWRSPGRISLACRVIGVVLPLLTLALVFGAHLPPHDGLPVALRVLRAIAASSTVLVALTVALILIAFGMDTRRMRAGDEPGTDRISYPFSPAAAADSWTLAITGPGNSGPPSPFFYVVTAAVWAACCAITYPVRDLLFVLGAHLRDPKEPAVQASSRGRAAATLTRLMRAEAFVPLDPTDGPGRRYVRASGVAALVALLAAGAGLARLGDDGPVEWLAAARNAIFAGTTDLSAAGLATAAVALIAALVLLTGAPGTARDEHGARRLLLDRQRGSITFTQAGPLAQRVRTSTVPELALDAVTTAITLIPAPILRPFTGSATSGPARAVVSEFCADPARMIARRRRQLSSAPDDTGALLAVRTGTWDAASRRRWVDSRLASRSYRITSADGRTSVPAEGLSLAGDGAAMLEATHLHRQGAGLLYEGQAPVVFAERLLAPFDDEMRRYATVIRDPHNPVSRLRLVIGSQGAANVLGTRAREILGPDIDLLIVIDPVED